MKIFCSSSCRLCRRYGQTAAYMQLYTDLPATFFSCAEPDGSIWNDRHAFHSLSAAVKLSGDYSIYNDPTEHPCPSRFMNAAPHLDYNNWNGT